MAFESSGDSDVLDISIEVVCLDDLQAWSWLLYTSLNWHHHLPDSIEQLDAEVVQPTDEMVAGVLSNHHIRLVDPIQLLDLTLYGLFIGIPCKFHFENVLDLSVHDSLAHFYVSEGVFECH